MAFYVDNTCPICGTGPLYFRRSADRKLIFIICFECDSIWIDPRDIRAETAYFPSIENAWRLPDGTFGKGGDADWATKEEITLSGFSGLIGGEYDEM